MQPFDTFLHIMAEELTEWKDEYSCFAPCTEKKQAFDGHQAQEVLTFFILMFGAVYFWSDQCIYITKL